MMLGMIWSVFNIIADLRLSFMKLQVLVLSPTRELAVQIQKVVLALGDYMNVQVYIRPLEYFSNRDGHSQKIVHIVHNFIKFIKVDVC